MPADAQVPGRGEEGGKKAIQGFHLNKNSAVLKRIMINKIVITLKTETKTLGEGLKGRGRSHSFTCDHIEYRIL